MGSRIEFESGSSFRTSVDEFEKFSAVCEKMESLNVVIDRIDIDRPSIQIDCRNGCWIFPDFFIGDKFRKDLIEGTPRIKINGIKGGIRNPHFHLGNGEIALLNREKFQEKIMGGIIIDGAPAKKWEDEITFEGSIKFSGKLSEFEKVTDLITKAFPSKIKYTPTGGIPGYDPRLGRPVFSRLLDNPGFANWLSEGAEIIRIFPFPGGLKIPHIHMLKGTGISLIAKDRFREAMGIIIVETRQLN